MEQEILSELAAIKSAIYILIAIVTIGVVANFIRVYFTSKNYIRNELNDLFEKELEEMFDDGRYNELLEKCEKKLKSSSNHTYALWYKGKALFQLGEYERAKEVFGKIIVLQPSWEEGTVKPYLQKIEQYQNENR